MVNHLKLFMVVVGCRPKGRFTEQHDVFFGIATSLKELIPNINAFWPEAKGNFHIDAWREVTQVNGMYINVITRKESHKNDKHLFFINLGGYKQGELDEYHYKLLVTASTSAEAISQAKKTPFYAAMGFKGATSHIDDKYSLDVDEIYNIKDMLASEFKKQYTIHITQKETPADELHIGYFKVTKILSDKH